MAVKIFEEIEGNMRFVFFASVRDDGEIALKTNRVDLMTHGFEGRDNVVLGPPGLFLFFDSVVKLLGRHEPLTEENQNTQFGFRLESHNGIRW